MDVFCTLDELWGWLTVLCQERAYTCIFFPTLGEEGQLWVPGCPRPGAFYGAYAYAQAFLPGSLKWADQKPKLTPCIEIRRGFAKGDSVLLMTGLSACRVFGHDDNRKALSWLQRRIARETIAGVVAENRVTGGRGTYRNIRFTAGAADFLTDLARTWRSAMSDRIVYLPAPT